MATSDAQPTALTGIGVSPGLVAGPVARMAPGIPEPAIETLPAGTDLDAEAPMALANRELGGPETVLLIASPAHAHVSSSLVKDIASYGGDVTPYVPPAVATALAQRLAATPGP